ncbi:hypothetical protein IPM62_05740 [Candidatus Woesebacteria bacterium]|nr:MAG: hypothetical protein IPM62_05740 [Candidatus Woesebacteria bacterium]
MMKKNILLIFTSVIIVGTLAFVGGMQYQKSKLTNVSGRNFPDGVNRPNGMQARSDNGQFNRPIAGEIINGDDNTLTVKSEDGNNIVVFSDSTVINKTSQGSKDDLAVGESVMVIGTKADSGTINATSISVGASSFRDF